MLRLVKLGGCVHVYDDELTRFIKCSARNVAQAIGISPQKVGREWKPTRRQMIFEAGETSTQKSSTGIVGRRKISK
jgi:hypothetical protein